MYKSLNVIILGVLLGLFILNSTSFAQSASDNYDWDNASPAQIHQKLWESKSQAMLGKQIIRQLASSDYTAAAQTSFDVLFYDIDIQVFEVSEILVGAVEFVAETVDPSISSVDIDLYSNMVIDSIIAGDGATFGYTRNGNVVTVTLDQTYTTGEQFSFTIYYYGHPSGGGFQDSFFDSYNGRPMISSLSEPYFARTWWPCKDRMDDKADSFNIAITVNTDFYCASNGTLDSTIDNGNNTHTFYYNVDYPMATYLFSIAIHNYTVWYDEWVYNGGLDTMELVQAIFPEWYNYSLSHYNVTPKALDHLSANFGLYPYPDEKYGHANFTWGGGMEHQTMTSMGASSFGFSEPVVVHELGHQWWGDMITCETWGDIWLNEGWASYSEAVYYLEEGGWSQYHSYMNSMRYTNGGSIYIYDTTSVGNIFGSIVYDKGAWVCHMLRGVLGDSLFFEGIDAYYNSAYKFASATTADFKNVFETASGQELDWFFEDWIYGTYFPTYDISYYQEPSDTGGYDVYVFVRQRQTSAPQIFRMPVDFSVAGVGQPVVDTVRFFNDSRDQLFSFNYPYEVDTIKLDPSDWILKVVNPQIWAIKIISTSEDISVGQQYYPYLDTIVTIGTDNKQSYVIGGALPSGLSLAMDGTISGTTSDTGSFHFRVQVLETMTGRYDVKEFDMYVAPSDGIPGDIDLDGEVTISDLLYLVDYQFDFGPAPQALNLADVNADCTIDIADLLYFVDYQFDSGPDPLAGCVE